MKVFLLFTGSSPLVITTSYDSIEHPALINKLADKGITKFISHEIPIALVRERYHGHLEAVLQDLHDSDDLRILDYNGQRVFNLFRFDELGAEVMHDPG